MKLAIDGGRPVWTGRFAPWPWHEEDEVDAAREVLRTQELTYRTGRQGRLFEHEFAAVVNTRYSAALINDTVALEGGLIGLGLCPGDEVIVPCRSFIAPSGCVALRGGVPVPVDVDGQTQTITAVHIAAAVTSRTKGIIVVHLAGMPCDMEPILALAKDKGLWVVEDCGQALGATYHGRPVGSMGDVGVFSFCQDMILSTGGEGGMLTTNRPDVWELVCSLSDQGKAIGLAGLDHAGGQGEATTRGCCTSWCANWRLTEFQSAIGRAQLRKLPVWLELRRRNANILAAGLKNIAGLRIPPSPANVEPAWYRFYAFLLPKHLLSGWNRDLIIAAINAEGVPCHAGCCPDVTREKAFGQNQPEDHPAAQKLGETSLAFPVHPTLNIDEMDAVVQAVTKVMNLAVR